MMPMFYDPTMLLVIPALILAIWAQYKVKSAYAKYSRVPVRSGLSGAEVAQLILRGENIPLVQDPESHPGQVVCGLTCIAGELNDHYDPRAKTLRLSEDVYYGTNVAALGVAAHEVGHAIQHARAFGPLMLRNVIYPVCSIGSTLAFPLFFIGLLAGFPPLLKAAILLFAAAVFFTVLTLPVELDASRRALKALAGSGYLEKDELRGARRVLTAAAMTYVAAMAMAVLQLLRMLILARGRD